MSRYLIDLKNQSHPKEFQQRNQDKQVTTDVEEKHVNRHLCPSISLHTGHHFPSPQYIGLEGFPEKTALQELPTGPCLSRSKVIVT